MRPAGLGIVGHVVDQRRIADRPPEAIGLAHAQRSHRVVVAVGVELFAADAAFAVTAAVGEHAEQPLEQVAAVAALHLDARAPVAVEARHFLQDRLALLRHGLAGADALRQVLHVLASAQHVAGQRTAFGRKPPSRLGVIVAALPHIGALRALHFALQALQLATLGTLKIRVALQRAQRRLQSGAVVCLGVRGRHIDQQPGPGREQQDGEADEEGRGAGAMAGHSFEPDGVALHWSAFGKVTDPHPESTRNQRLGAFRRLMEAVKNALVSQYA